MSRLSFGRGAIKPPPGALIDLDHPFSRGLVICAPMNEYGSYTNDNSGSAGTLITLNTFVGSGAVPRLGTTYPTTNRTMQWGSNREGPALIFDNAFDVLDLGNGVAFPTNAATLCVIRRKVDTTARGTKLFGLGTDGPSVFPFTGTGSLIRAQVPFSDGHVYWQFGDTSVAGSSLDIAGLSFTTIEERWIFRAGASGHSVWRNGVIVGSNATAAIRALSPASGSDGSLFVGNASSLVEADFQELNFFHSVGVEWSDDLCRWWSAEPYAHLYTPRNKAVVYFMAGISSPPDGLMVDGVIRNFRIETFRRPATTNGVDTLTVDIISDDGSYRPAPDQEIYYRQNGIALFGGWIQTTSERGLTNEGGIKIVTAISAVSFASALRRRFVTAAIPSGSLADALAVVQSYLDAYGLTLDLAQEVGPTLEAMTVVRESAETLLNRISTLSGYIWQFTYEKVWRMVRPGAEAAPTNIVEGDIVDGDLTVRPTRDKYANRIIVPSDTTDVVDSFVGDGVTSTFTLSAAIYGPLPYIAEAAIGYAVVDIPPTGSESLGGLLSTTIWLHDPVAKTIFRTLGPVGAGTPFSVRYISQFPVDYTANDLAEQAAHGIWEAVESAPSGMTAGSELQAYANGVLAVRILAPDEVAYSTYTTGLKPGQSQNILVTDRNVGAAFIITDVTLRNHFGNLLIYDVVALEGNGFQGGWRDFYRQILGASQAAVIGATLTDVQEIAAADSLALTVTEGTPRLPLNPISGRDTLAPQLTEVGGHVP